MDGCNRVSGCLGEFGSRKSPSSKRPCLVSPPSMETPQSQHSSPYDLSSPLGGIQGFQSSDESPALSFGQSPDSNHSDFSTTVETESDARTSPVIDAGSASRTSSAPEKSAEVSADEHHRSSVERLSQEDTNHSPLPSSGEQPVATVGESTQQCGSSEDAPVSRLSPLAAGATVAGSGPERDDSPTPWLDDTSDEEGSGGANTGIPEFDYGSPPEDDMAEFCADGSPEEAQNSSEGNLPNGKVEFNQAFPADDAFPDSLGGNPSAGGHSQAADVKAVATSPDGKSSPKPAQDSSGEIEDDDSDGSSCKSAEVCRTCFL